ncbi:MAG: FAD-dependent oxidoreductase [Woeseia sp.]|nr:NAD(P)/FAD-dependent oxidoreductase [Gammaproteobacteria bacterium]NNE61915.1 FAD-dependent oxidoreductase [Woeseia sp.]
MGSRFDCIILGGGPAGLSVAYRLSRYPDIDYMILERGRLGHSWSTMHDSLKLLSPMWVNQLPGHRFPLWRSFAKISKNEFIEYLESYAQRYRMHWTGNAPVARVTRDGGEFVVSTGTEEFRSRAVVNATGYYSAPQMPKFSENDGSIPVIHSADYESPDALDRKLGPGKKNILIIGKRVSAGQLLEELDDAGFSLGISVRAPIETRVGGILGIIKENLYFVREKLRFLRNPYIKQNSLALMNGGKTDRIISSGRLQQHGTIERIRNGHIEFADGSTAAYDLVICATGFVTDYPHLEGLLEPDTPLLEQLDMGEHREVPGLFFIGVDNLISFKSRYVRGIADDSAEVGTRLRRYLSSAKDRVDSLRGAEQVVSRP